jgi:hypothetical protein
MSSPDSPPPRIYVDLSKIDGHNAVRLVAEATRQDIERHGIELAEGLTLALYTDDADPSVKPDDLVFTGIASFKEETDEWVAIIDYDPTFTDCLGPV